MEHDDSGVWDKSLPAGSVVGSCWDMLQDISGLSSDSPNKSLGTATKGLSMPCRRQGQDPKAPRAGFMTLITLLCQLSLNIPQNSTVLMAV